MTSQEKVQAAINGVEMLLDNVNGRKREHYDTASSEMILTYRANLSRAREKLELELQLLPATN